MEKSNGRISVIMKLRIMNFLRLPFLQRQIRHCRDEVSRLFNFETQFKKRMNIFTYIMYNNHSFSIDFNSCLQNFEFSFRGFEILNK